MSKSLTVLTTTQVTDSPRLDVAENIETVRLVEELARLVGNNEVDIAHLSATREGRADDFFRAGDTRPSLQFFPYCRVELASGFTRHRASVVDDSRGQVRDLDTDVVHRV